MSQAAPAARAALRALTWAQSHSTPGEELRELIAVAGPALLLPVNSVIASPRGFRRSTPTRKVVSLSAVADVPGEEDQNGAEAGVPRVALEALLGSDAVLALRTVPGATIDERSWSTPWQVAAAVTALCCAGVPVLTHRLCEPVRSMLDPELLAAGDLLDVMGVRDPDRREALSIGLRRAAHRAYGFRPPLDPPHPTVSVVVERAALTDRLRAELAAQSWPRVSLHVVQEVDPAGGASLLHDVRAAGSIYLTRMSPGVSYGPHHLEDLVHALRHSGCAVACSPPRFTDEPEHRAIVERSATPAEVTSPTRAELAGTALWYADDGLTSPVGPAYLGHGCNAVQIVAEPSDRAPTSIVYRRSPPQLAWFEADPAPPGGSSARSYFARAGSRASS